jgi:hypothetical protein
LPAGALNPELRRHQQDYTASDEQRPSVFALFWSKEKLIFTGQNLQLARAAARVLECIIGRPLLIMLAQAIQKWPGLFQT